MLDLKVHNKKLKNQMVNLQTENDNLVEALETLTKVSSMGDLDLFSEHEKSFENESIIGKENMLENEKYYENASENENSFKVLDSTSSSSEFLKAKTYSYEGTTHLADDLDTLLYLSSDQEEINNKSMLSEIEDDSYPKKIFEISFENEPEMLTNFPNYDDLYEKPFEDWFIIEEDAVFETKSFEIIKNQQNLMNKLLYKTVNKVLPCTFVSGAGITPSATFPQTVS